MGLHTILKWVALVLAVLGVLFVGMIWSGNLGMIDNMLYIAYVVLAILLVIVLLYVVKGLFSGNVKKTLISVGLFLVIGIISYALSSGSDLDLLPFQEKGMDVTESTSKNVGAGLYMFYVLAIMAVGSMVLSGIKKVTK